MKYTFLVAVVCALLTACNRSSDDQSSAQGTSGSGVIYSHGGANARPAQVQQGASETATDLRPTGGSMAGAGGAGPGYDGSAQGLGKHGTIPGPGAGFASGLTNSSAAPNTPVEPAPNTQAVETANPQSQPAAHSSPQSAPDGSPKSSAEPNPQARQQ